MITGPRTNALTARIYALERDVLLFAHSDAQGVPVVGRTAELGTLRRIGARDLSLGRIFEGHLNAAQLIARFGSSQQRTAAGGAIDAGLLFGVWNTEDAPMRVERRDGAYVLRGAKTWASGAASVVRPIVTAAWPDGTVQMCLVPLDAVVARIDASAWRPLGMDASDSFTVDFEGVALGPHDLIGEPGDYTRQPWFHGGALRFAAVQTGAIDRLTDETIGYLRARGRDGDPFQCARVAEMRIASRTAGHWLTAGAGAWSAFDADPSAANSAAVLETVDMARTVVERAALDTIERAVRCVGARGLIEPLPFPRLVRDLQMYLRQPAPDAALQRVGRAAFAAATSLC